MSVNLLLYILDGLGPSKDDIISKLIPSVPAFVIQLCAFIVLILVVFFLAYKPVKKRLQARKKYELDKLKKAEENLKISEQKIKEADDIILDSKEKALEIVEQGKATSKKQGEAIIKQAELDASELKEKALEDVKAENEKLKDELYKETVDLSLTAASKLIGKEMNSETNEKLANDFIEELKNKEDKK